MKNPSLEKSCNESEWVCSLSLLVENNSGINPFLAGLYDGSISLYDENKVLVERKKINTKSLKVAKLIAK